MIFILLIVFWIISIAIYAIMAMQRMFKDVLPDWDKSIADDRPTGLILMAFIGGWMFMPYFVWLMWKYIKERTKKPL